MDFIGKLYGLFYRYLVKGQHQIVSTIRLIPQS